MLLCQFAGIVEEMKKHRVRKDPITKAEESKHPYRVFDADGNEVRVDAESDEEARVLAKAWPWKGKVTVERVKA